MAKKKPTPKAKEGHPWSEFLYHRARVIHWLRSEGKSDAEIAATLSMDPVQVTLIAMTPLEDIHRA